MLDGIDARSAVSNRDFYQTVCRQDARVDDAAVRREFDRILEQVPHHLLQASGIAGNDDRRGRQGCVERDGARAAAVLRTVSTDTCTIDVTSTRARTSRDLLRHERRR